MTNLSFSPIAWDHYLSWQQQDRKMVKRINELLSAWKTWCLVYVSVSTHSRSLASRSPTTSGNRPFRSTGSETNRLNKLGRLNLPID